MANRFEFNHHLRQMPRIQGSQGLTRLAAGADGPPRGWSIGPHVDAPLPAALQRVDDIQPHAPDMLHLDLDGLAVLQGAEPLVVGAAGDDVAGIEGHDRRGELDKLGNPMLHIVGVVGYRFRVRPSAAPE